MEIIKATAENLADIMKIIDEAKEYFKTNGINQWQNGSPNEEIILSDISNGESFLIKKDGKIIATAMISLEEEPTYKKIYDGSWLSDEKYCVLHRIAVLNAEKRSGIASLMFAFAEKLASEKNAKSLRADTHKDNIAMQKTLKRNGFSLCGTIYLESGAARLGFEKVLI